MSDPAVIYALDAYEEIVLPYDSVKKEDIEDLGTGYVVRVWVPASRLEDLDRNDTLRREVTAAIRTKIAEVE